MSSRGRLAKNVGILMGMELGVKALDVVTSIILARYLAPHGFGLLAFAISFASFFGVLPGFGMGSLAMRDLARDPDRLQDYLSNGLIAKAILSVAALGLMGVVVWSMGYPPARSVVVLLAGTLVALEATLRFCTAFFQAAQRMTPVATLSLARQGGFVLTALWVVWFKGGIIEVLGLRVLVYLAILATSVWLIDRRLQRIRWGFNLPFTWQILKASFPFALMSLFVADINTVMLSMMQGDAMTGWYAAAQKFWVAFTFIPLSMRGVLLPAMAKLSRESPSALGDSLTRSCRYLVMIALPIAGGIFVLADRLVAFVYGSAYLAAVPVLRILIWTLLFDFVNHALMPALAAVDRERQASVCLGIAALVGILTNLIAIPRWGHVGAAMTTLLSVALVCGLQGALLLRVLSQPRPVLLSRILKPLGATAVMMAFAWLNREGGLAYTILASAVVYLGCLIASRAVGRDEWALIGELWHRRALDEPVV